MTYSTHSPPRISHTTSLTCDPQVKSNMQVMLWHVLPVHLAFPSVMQATGHKLVRCVFYPKASTFYSILHKGSEFVAHHGVGWIQEIRDEALFHVNSGPAVCDPLLTPDLLALSHVDEYVALRHLLTSPVPDTQGFTLLVH